MKKIIFSVIGLFLLATAALAVTGYPSKYRITNLSLTSEGTRYYTAIPPGTGAIQVQSRPAADCMIYFDTVDNGIYYTLKSGAVLNVTPISADTTIYAQGTEENQVLEILYWQ